MKFENYNKRDAWLDIAIWVVFIIAMIIVAVEVLGIVDSFISYIDHA